MPMPATSATTAIFKWVARSPLYIEWFIAVSECLPLLSGIHGMQPLPVAKHDLTGAGKPEHALIVQLRKRP